MRAKDIMTTGVVSISPAANIHKAISLMLANGISGLPVVDDTGRICGMLTEGDLLSRREIKPIVRSSEEQALDLERYVQGNGWSVGDVMSQTVVSADPQTDVADLADIMRRRKIKRIPIIEDGKPVGIVSRRDVLRAMSNSGQDAVAAGDDAIRLAIVTRLHADLGLGREMVEVTVSDAQVLIKGDIESELLRRAVKVLVEGVRGVNGYVDRMNISAGTVNT